jgi:uncharacterized protein (TIGR02996 family)
MTETVTDDYQSAEEAALVQAIIDQPEEDTPRLVYADWLQEHDQPERAEFIRIQCQLARLTEHDVARPGLQERQESLLGAHVLEWVRPLGELGAYSIDFERGFPCGFRIFASSLFANADRIFALAPIAAVYVEKLGEFGEPIERLLALSQLSRLKSLAAKGRLLGDDVAKLASCSRLKNLTSLDLGGNLIGTEGCRALAASPHLSGLRSLRVSANDLYDDAIAALIEHPLFASSLASLDVSANHFSDTGAEAIARSSLSSLEALDLNTNRIGTKGAEAIANSSTLPTLHIVHLHNNRIGARALNLIGRVRRDYESEEGVRRG